MNKSQDQNKTNSIPNNQNNSDELNLFLAIGRMAQRDCYPDVDKIKKNISLEQSSNNKKFI